MKKTIKIAAITFTILFFIYLIANQTGILKTYKSPTTSNEPNLKANTTFFVSNLISPKAGDFVSYNHEDRIMGKHVRVHRLAAMEGDIIQLKDGILYVNEKNADTIIELMHTYKVTKSEYDKLVANDKITDINMTYPLDENTAIIHLEDPKALYYGLIANRHYDVAGKTDEAIKKTYNQNWNKDNFGPLKIPQGKVFVLGDNRDNSEDSRYIGLIDKAAIEGVVIKK